MTNGRDPAHQPGTQAITRLAGCAPTPAALGDTLTLATWPNYHDQEILDTFTQ
ncbi:hypothetical protein BH20CHL7_BH20CHL7_19730 [soil metagenome]